MEKRNTEYEKRKETRDREIAGVNCLSVDKLGYTVTIMLRYLAAQL